ncbi:ABC transporter substrate-binding protein [Actinacidiphila yeochonensis]|uniref:ABC transporter substrate-binding protein n=1 Tax=Actinacidiphila yeochonensis TaxID=89050 RepID=UPI000B1DB6B0|nr:extracellular solute-binding protein [Actinacidiphila yeochonensis]
MYRPGKTSVLLAAAALTALGTTACGGSSGSSAQDHVLNLWHYEDADSAMGIAWKEAVKEFQQQNPGWTVKVSHTSFEQIQKTAPMLLNSPKAPDIMEYNKGNATAGLLSKEGLLTDLSPAARSYGWDAKLPAGIQATSRYSDGVMGSGNWYGVPDYAEYAMVYYNKDLFAKYHVAVPTTWDQFTAALATFKAAGVTPLADGGAEYPAQQYLWELALRKADPSWIKAYEETGKADFHDAAWTYAADTFADWVKRGYIARNSVSQKAQDMGDAFEAGSSPMMVSGDWWYGGFESEITAFSWGTFLIPGSTYAAGSGGNLWVVPKNSKHADMAEKFINLTLQPTIQNLLAAKGQVPVAADPSAVSDPRARELVQNYRTIVGRDGLAFYPDWPVPDFYATLTSATQNLMNGQSPQSVLSSLQSAYTSGFGH